MESLFTSVRLLALSAAFFLPFGSASVHAAGNANCFVRYSGEGNLLLFDATASTGGWVGAIDQSAFSAAASPFIFVSQVLFTLDASSHTLSGSCVFNTTDLASSLFGNFSGSCANADVFQFGCQRSIACQVFFGGSGQLAGANGFGLSLLDFDPAGSFNNHSEAGFLSLTAPVPELSTWLLVAFGVGVAGLSDRRLMPSCPPPNFYRAGAV